jgi:hypothetical protein
VERQRVRHEPRPSPIRPVRGPKVAMGVPGRALRRVMQQRPLRQPLRRAPPTPSTRTLSFSMGIIGGSVGCHAVEHRRLVRSGTISGGSGGKGDGGRDCASLLSSLTGAGKAGGFDAFAPLIRGLGARSIDGHM